jgi:hypothetical protein
VKNLSKRLLVFFENEYRNLPECESCQHRKDPHYKRCIFYCPYRPHQDQSKYVLEEIFRVNETARSVPWFLHNPDCPYYKTQGNDTCVCEICYPTKIAGQRSPDFTPPDSAGPASLPLVVLTVAVAVLTIIVAVFKLL